MSLNVLLPWLPIVLAAGVGARLLGPRRGLVLAGLFTLFWVALVCLSPPPGFWDRPWSVAVIAAGAMSILALGSWSGSAPASSAKAGAIAAAAAPRAPAARVVVQDVSMSGIAAAIEQFDDWLETNRNDNDPWPEFGEFARSTLYQICQATHVRLYRILAEGEELVPLREVDPADPRELKSSRKGIIGHVVTTGRAYLAGDQAQGELVRALAGESDEPLAWVFPVSQGARRIGVVTVGQFNGNAADNQVLLRASAHLINHFWNCLGEACRGRSAGRVDPVSGLLVREAFFASAGLALEQAYAQGEPAVVAVIALEQLRHLSDSGRWEIADQVIRESAALLQRKVRTDDCLGRFDGTRFLLFLRRVDSNLAMLILEQLMSRLKALCGNEVRWGVAVRVRCGVSGSGTTRPPLTAMVAQAMRMCRQARIDEVNIASDLGIKTAGSDDRTANGTEAATQQPNDESKPGKAVPGRQRGQPAPSEDSDVTTSHAQGGEPSRSHDDEAAGVPRRAGAGAKS
ncbi:MAG: diguanylate cyclase [Phycisphaerales bacterium]|nr:MAG: diguanylate cyclase [Phycisphaerales bacterium]